MSVGANESRRQRPVEGETNEWYTPPELFAALGLAFDLDPCAPPGGVSWIPAARTYSFADNGLAQPWEGRVWLNPPYGPHTGRWLARLADHGDGVALVFARTDVAWFQSLAPRADMLCFVRGRISFRRGDGSPGPGRSAAAASVLMAFGDECADALYASGLGMIGEMHA